MVYGFFPHSWLQHVRGGGFRPIVFMNHGLVLGIFLSMAVVASAIMVRLSTRRGPHALFRGNAVSFPRFWFCRRTWAH